MQTSDQVALVTGGGSGLGRATAEHLHARGCAVVVADLPASGGADVAGALGAGAAFAPCDVTDPAAVTAALDAAAGFGHLRIAVNCAGIVTGRRVLGRTGPFPLEDFTRVVAVNLVGTFNVLRLAAERMAAAPVVDGERGVVVNTASVAAFDGQVGQAAYSAAKGGVAAMTLPLARDLADSLIRVVTIAPGLFETPMVASLPASTREALAAAVPHPSRPGRPEEFAALVAHVVENPMLNGEVIRLDGGIRMAPR